MQRIHKWFIFLLFISSPFSVLSQSGTIDHWEMYVNAAEDWSYFLGIQQPPADWYNLTFDDSSWDTGPGGFGYGDNDDATVISPVNSIYIRQEFTVNTVPDILGGLFYIDYDDAFVAYLNGTEFARGNIGTPGIEPSYDTYATTNTHEAQLYQGGVPEHFVITLGQLNSLIQSGNNVLAIQIHNYGTGSSDLSAIPYLFLATSDTDPYTITLPSWFDDSQFGFQTHLPIISIQTNGLTIPNDPKITADMQVYNRQDGFPNSLLDDDPEYDGKIGIELRGNSSLSFPKSSYLLETRLINGENNNVSLLGLPEENDWILYGPYSDKSLIRNALVYDLSNRMGWWAPHTVFCEVFVNNDYRGIYLFTEKIKRDKNRVDIDELGPDDNWGSVVSGGYIFKNDWADPTSGYDWTSPVSYFNGLNLNLNYLHVYPDPDDISFYQDIFIENFVSSFEEGLVDNNYTDLFDGYRKYIDPMSFADFFILQELSFNIDAYRLSNYYHKTRADKGGKIFAGPVWDFNLGFGNCDYGDGWLTSGWALENPYVTEVIPFHLKRLRQDVEFKNMLRCRWDQYRSTILSDQYLEYLIDSMVTYLGPAIDRNFERWNILGNYVWPNYYVGNTHTEEIEYLKGYIEDRVAWIDANLPGAGSVCASYYQSKIVISEINFVAESVISPHDWFEIQNVSQSPINISGWVFKDEKNINTFTVPEDVIIEADERIVVCSNLNSFYHYFSTDIRTLGPFNWNLGDNDRIRIFDQNSYLVCDVDYDNDGDWPIVNETLSETLELDNYLGENDDPLNWFIGCPGGSPGTAYTLPCPALSIHEESKALVNLYPNPVSTTLHIQGENILGASLELSSPEGWIVYKTTIDEDAYELNMKNLAAGIYLLKISTQDDTFTHQVVKQ